MGKAEWGDNPVCWWLGLYFCFVYCLDEASWTGCDWWLGDARSCIQVVSFMWILTTWYSLGLFLWQSMVLESVLPFQRLRAWSLKEHLFSFFSCLTPFHSQWGRLWPEGHWHYQTAGACCCWQGQRATGSSHHNFCSPRTDLKSSPIPAPSSQGATSYRAVENLEVPQLPGRQCPCSTPCQEMVFWTPHLALSA